MNASGKILRIEKEKEINDKFKVRNFVVEQKDGEYSNYFPFQLINDNTTLIDVFKEGDNVSVSYYVKGSYSEKYDRYFVNLNAVGVNKDGEGREEDIKAAQEKLDNKGEQTDDLPF